MKTPLDAVAFMIEYLEPGDFEAGARAALLYLGIPAEKRGCCCLLMAIQMQQVDPEASLTKEIYPAIAKEMGYRGWKRVEKQIRDAIAAGWKNGDPEVWEMYFPSEGRPSNSKFIFRIVEMLNLWTACVKQNEPV